MRRAFAAALAEHMAKNEAIHTLVADVGYGMFDHIAKTYPARFWNVGAAEQAMVGMGVGLALAGKIPVCYSITPFLLWRPAELIRNYLHGERVPVILVGSGRGRDYSHDGPTHWCEDDQALLTMWKNIGAAWPRTPEEAKEVLGFVLKHHLPAYINLKR